MFADPAGFVLSGDKITLNARTVIQKILLKSLRCAKYMKSKCISSILSELVNKLPYNCANQVMRPLASSKAGGLVTPSAAAVHVL